MKLKWLKPDFRKKRHHIKIAYDVDKHILLQYDKHERNGNVWADGKIVGNTHDGNMICGLSNINKIVFK